MDGQLVALSVIRTASAICAAVLGVVAYRAHRRTRSQALLWLSIASTLLVMGLLGAGLLYQSTGSLTWASIFEAPFTLAAFVVILASLYSRDRRHAAQGTGHWRHDGPMGGGVILAGDKPPAR